MSEDKFLVAVKSTIDKLGNDLAQSQVPPALFVDLDDSTATEDAMSSEADAIVWELGTLEEEPADPLYMLTFSIGARTTNDAANYDILRLTGKVREHFKKGNTYRVRDYSDLVASVEMGVIRITDVVVMQQSFDRTSGVRLVTVYARAQRFL